MRVDTEQRFPEGPLAEAWEGLVADDPHATVFHRAAFLRLWCRHLRGDCDLRLRFVHDDGRLVGVVPEVREVARDGLRTVHFAGGIHVTDYLGPVSRLEDRRAVADAWVAELAREGDWDRLVVAGLAEDSGWDRAIADAAAGAGLEVGQRTAHEVCPRIDVTGGWDAYLGRITGKQRHEIRRKARKLAREAGVVKLVAVAPEELDDCMTEFLELNRRLEDDKGRFFVSPAMDAFFHALARTFGPDRTLRMHRLDVDGRPAAITVTLVYPGPSGTEWGLYNSAYEREFGPLAPGMVLVGELVRLAAEDGAVVVDLLRGDEPYKYRFGASDRRLCRLEVRCRRASADAEGRR